MTFTIILLLPDYATSSWPHDAHIVSEQEHDDEESAINAAQYEAADQFDLDDMHDTKPLFVLHGHKIQLDSADLFYEG